MIEEAFKFTEKIKNFKGILSIILFGSVARGEETPQSDIDLAVIYSERDVEVVNKINSMAPENFQILHLTLPELSEESTIAGALSGEGILLHGSPVVVEAEEIELKSRMLISYNTSRMKQNQRSKLQRTLYGGISTYLKGNERKVKHYPGLVDKIKAQRVGKGVLMVERHNAPEITKTLKMYGAKWKEVPVWTY